MDGWHVNDGQGIMAKIRRVANFHERFDAPGALIFLSLSTTMITLSESSRAVIVSLAALASMVFAMIELDAGHTFAAATHAFGSLALGLLAIDGASKNRAVWLRVTTLLSAVVFVGFVGTRIWRSI